MDLEKGCDALKQEVDIAYRTGELNTIQKYCTFVGRKSCDFAAAITFMKGLTSGGGKTDGNKIFYVMSIFRSLPIEPSSFIVFEFDLVNFFLYLGSLAL